MLVPSENINLFALSFHGRISVNDDTVPQNNSISPVEFPPEISAVETLKNSGYDGRPFYSRFISSNHTLLRFS
jgi:hypothetical protein